MSGKYIAYGILGLIGFIILMLGLGILSLPIHSISKQSQAAHDIIDETYTADNAIYNYEWFKLTYEDIQATEKNIRVTEQQIVDFKTMYGSNATEWDYTTKQQYGQLTTQLTGQRLYYNDLRAEYNAKANMVNRNIFNDNLPMFIDELLPMTNL